MANDKKVPFTPTSHQQQDAPPTYEAAQGDAHALVERTTTLAQQPVAIPQMTIGGSRNAKGLDVGLDGKRTWSHTLLSCHERPALTAAACCCPCMVYSSNHHRLTHVTATGQPAPSSEPVSLWCLMYSISPQLFGVGQIGMQWLARFQTRSRYAIRGNPVHDVLVAAFCTTCSLVQESREIEEEEEALRTGLVVPETVYRDEEDAVAVGPERA
ncbi:hypothetical protein JCM10212_000746 [Sporobolomyces blumeae]